MSRRYPKEFHDFVKAHASEGTIEDMRQRVTEIFGIDITYEQMRCYFSNRHLHSMPRKGRARPESKVTTPEMDKFILEHFKGTGHQAMADMVNERFGTSFTKEQMKGYYARNKLNSGLTGRFEKGQQSFNKGLKQSDFMSPEAIERTKATRFQKGHTPHNGGTPVGVIRLRHDHKDRGGRPYYWIKTAQPNVWRMYHVMIWEEHNGPVPDGCMITFADGNSLNCCIDNLVLETRAQHAIKNHMGLRGYDKESAETLNRIADLKQAITRTKKRRKTKT